VEWFAKYNAGGESGKAGDGLILGEPTLRVFQFRVVEILDFRGGEDSPTIVGCSMSRQCFKLNFTSSHIALAWPGTT
jgi:hypothetical protein